MKNEYLILGQEEVYKASPSVWSFKKVDDIVHGINLNLSNMAGGYPFIFGSCEWEDSERLYLCGEFSNNTEEHCEVQRQLKKAKSGYAAKRFVKAKYKSLVREDFLQFRLQWMLYVVWQKCKGNEDFRKRLLEVPDDVVLLENTTTDNGGTADIWGCRNRELVNARKTLADKLANDNPKMRKKDLERLINVETNKIDSIGEWRGQNNIGKILMMCRNCIVGGLEPTIDLELLRKAEIHILGEKLTFD